MRYVGIYTFLLRLGTALFYRSNIFRYCGHDVLSGRHCITNAKKDERRRDREKLQRYSGSTELLHAFSGTSWTGLSLRYAVNTYSSSSHSKMPYVTRDILRSWLRSERLSRRRSPLIAMAHVSQAETVIPVDKASSK